MTLDEVKALRDKYYNALVAYDPTAENHSIEGASYSHDEHRDSLQKQFEYYDKMYNVKSSAGKTLRLGKKAV